LDARLIEIGSLLQTAVRIVVDVKYLSVIVEVFDLTIDLPVLLGAAEVQDTVVIVFPVFALGLVIDKMIDTLQLSVIVPGFPFPVLFACLISALDLQPAVGIAFFVVSVALAILIGSDHRDRAVARSEER